MTLVTEDGETPAHPEDEPKHKTVSLGVTDEQVIKLKLNSHSASCANPSRGALGTSLRSGW